MWWQHKAPTNSGIALIGNAPINKRWAKFIDQHELVVRFNFCSSARTSGRRTDVLALINSGWPAKMMSAYPKRIPRRVRRTAKEVWFVRDTRMIADKQAVIDAGGPKMEDPDAWVDFTESLKSKTVPGKIYRMFDRSLWERAEEILRQHGDDNAKQPSSGLLVFLRLREIYPAKAIHLFGFTHEGWSGHAWDAEREFFSSQPGIERFD